MFVVFIIALIIVSSIYGIAKKRYSDFISQIDKKTYGLKDFMPISLYILDAAKYRLNTVYDRRLEIKLGELYEISRAKFYLKIHWANKIALLILVILIVLLLGSFMGSIDTSFYFFGITVLALTFYLPDRELEQKLKMRRLQIQIDFPEFLNKLVLLVNAGMTVSGAMEKIAFDKAQTENCQERPLYKELETTMHEMKLGKPEIKAYEDFAKRCRLSEVTRFTSILIQNLKKGNSEMVSILKLQSAECWNMRKNAAKILGEEAETKLLFPMMLMFLAVLIVVIAPSIMQLQGF